MNMISNIYETITIVLSMVFKIYHARDIQQNHQQYQAGLNCGWHVRERVLNLCCFRLAAIKTELARESVTGFAIFDGVPLCLLSRRSRSEIVVGFEILRLEHEKSKSTP